MLEEKCEIEFNENITVQDQGISLPIILNFSSCIPESEVIIMGEIFTGDTFSPYVKFVQVLLFHCCL